MQIIANLAGLVYCYQTEGFRMGQLPLVLCSVVFQPLNILACCSWLSYISILFQTLLIGLSTWIFSFGDPTFEKYPQRGKYDVGHKKIRTDKFDNEIVVFYPIEKGTATSVKSQRNKFSFIEKEFHQQFMTGLGRALKLGQKPFQNDIINQGWYRFLLDGVIDFSISHAKISKDFENGDNEMIPIVFSHGLSGCCRFYCGLLNDYASHGYIIFAISHRDKTASYTNDKDGNFYYFENEPKVFDFKLRNDQGKLDMPNIKINTQKLTSMGHSFGGITAVRAGYLSDKIKAIVSFDPWMYMHQKEAISGEMKVNKYLFTIMTETFPSLCPGYDQWAAQKALHQFNSTGMNESIILKNCHHNDQTDFPQLIPFEYDVLEKRFPRSDLREINYLNNQLGLLYLAKIGFSNYHTSAEIEQRIKGIKEKYAAYDVELTTKIN
ncbi:platelet-activating factor acetylhydrolase [Stylonychia lemnae]|uniref:1-alkyl-2-acetylglycerophosphocholine esterase n=1 Tax=Stylonychia lemnae TaxID=5949 RepID=A0A078AGH5_STYLE|nr:platelet-activating factor acetylhydrolase [Stylonychia lemnae]|eukprot:CDW80642.1 platelet-activating factor acetylhydrolase [Stylonychia lemnae]